MNIGELLASWKAIDQAAREELRRSQVPVQLPPLPSRGVNVRAVHAAEKRQKAIDGFTRAREQLAIAFSREAVDLSKRREAVRLAVEAYPRSLELAADRAGGKVSPFAMRRRWRRLTERSTRQVGELLATAMEREGHTAAMGDPQQYVQQEDLNELVPDGWGRTFPAEVRQLARRAALAPLAVPLLCILIWASRCRDPHPEDIRRRGAGAQLSIEWLAKKLGCSRSWVKVLLNRLDPHAAWRREVAAVRRWNERRRRGAVKRREPARPNGTPYVQRYRRLQRYERTRQAQGRSDVFWVDGRGRPHQWVDLRGVCYVTDAGAQLLQPREADGRERRNGALIDLASRGMRLRLLVSRRLERAVENPPEKSTSPPARAGAG